MKRILLLGPRIEKSSPATSGGGAILFEDLISQAEKFNLEYEVIDTNKTNYTNRAVAYVMIIGLFICKFLKYEHISLHGTYKDYILIAPMVVFFSKLFSKKVSLRKFAGNLRDLYEKSNFLSKFMIRYVLKTSDVNFFETKYLVEDFKNYNTKTYWFPNIRARPNITTNQYYSKRFIFLGHVRKEKGIDILCEASNLLSNEYRIDMYGGLLDNYTKEYFDDYQVQYKGQLNPKCVIDTLKEYDVLILPSFREGYPGVIVEAFSVGLPVIVTNLRGIKEMVCKESSVMIEPNNIKQLKKAIESFSNVNYKEKSAAALKNFDNFDSKIQTKIFFDRIGL